MLATSFPNNFDVSGPVVLEINESYVKTQDDGGFVLGVKNEKGKFYSSNG